MYFASLAISLATWVFTLKTIANGYCIFPLNSRRALGAPISYANLFKLPVGSCSFPFVDPTRTSNNSVHLQTFPVTRCPTTRQFYSARGHDVVNSTNFDLDHSATKRWHQSTRSHKSTGQRVSFTHKGPFAWLKFIATFCSNSQTRKKLL